jgi:hypothetical protein
VKSDLKVELILGRAMTMSLVCDEKEWTPYVGVMMRST